ncbi:DUF4276 family protein [Marinifilum sp.]|uniref:DUF4276 family protein n=1 Tax=Marinifilum sp. TaxID=2033137 RepID=UPI003BAD55C8
MNRIVFIVEGDTEILLVEKVIMPYIYELGYQISYNCQTITTNRKQHKKGGVGSYGKFKNEILRTIAQGDVLVTSLIDFFKLPTDFPSFKNDSNRIEEIEKGILEDFDSNPNLIPYIQRHEVEALMYSNMDGFELVMDDEDQLEKVQQIMDEYPNPEDINNSPETAPSKRLQGIFNYDKTGDGEMIFEMVGIQAMLDKCPRFAKWINEIRAKLDEMTNKDTI